MKNPKNFPVIFALIAALALSGCSAVAPTADQSDSAKPSSSSSTAPSSSASATPTESRLKDLTVDMAMSASIPSVCGFPAGKLSKGVLQKKHPQYSNASVPNIPSKKLVVAGDLTGDGIKELAAVIYCDKGGVRWPSHIQLFENTAKGIAALGKPFQMSDVNGGARGILESLKFTKGQLEVTDRQLMPMDPAVQPTGRIKAALKWDGKKLVATAIQDLANPENGTLKTATVNGTWCQLSAQSKINSKKCLEINYPQLTQKGQDPQSLTYWVNNGFTELAYFGAPLGTIYTPGTKIKDPANPSAPTAQQDQYRLYNSQTQETYVRQGK